MKPIIPPIKPAESGAAVANLQEILETFVQHEIIKIVPDEWNKMSRAFKQEWDSKTFGKATEKLVGLFRSQKNLGDHTEVDEETAKSINSLLPLIGHLLTIKGTILSPGKRPTPNVLVRAFAKDMRALEPVGETNTDNEGHYEIPYIFQKEDGGNDEKGFVVSAFDKSGKEISTSKVVFEVDDIAQIDLELPERRTKVPEYLNLVNEIQPLIGEHKLDQLNDLDLDFLAGHSQLSRDNLSILREAAIAASKYPNPAFVAVSNDSPFLVDIPIYYGWFRQSLPTDPQVLFSLQADELVKSAIAAMRSNLIPELSKDLLEKLRENINRISAEIELNTGKGKNPALGQVLKTIPVNLPIEKQLIVSKVMREQTDGGIQLGKKLKEAGLDDKQVAAVEKTFVLQEFTGNFLPLISVFQKQDEIKSLKDLALKYNRETLAKKIIDEKAYPTGQDPTKYANQLYTNLFHLETNTVLHNIITDQTSSPIEDINARSNVGKFLFNLPDTFDIKTDSVLDAFKSDKAFTDIKPEYIDQTKQIVQSLQRITAVSPVPQVVPVLLKNQVNSAFMISEMSEDQFVKTYSSSFGNGGVDIAKQIHSKALETKLQNEITIVNLRDAKYGTGIGLIDKGLKNSIHEEDVQAQGNNLSWDALFGDADVCECSECSSVYSAAAYFVDLLQFLRNNNLDNDPTLPEVIKRRANPKDITNTPLARLFARRPDLKTMELSCNNTNTVLPYVDLVNEIMENYVAYKKPLENSFNVDEETSAELLSQPQHTQFDAYRKLKDAVFPFSLPYHQPLDAIRIFLNYLGTNRHELMETFQPQRDKQNAMVPTLEGGIVSNDQITYNTNPYEEQTLDSLFKDYLQRSADAEYLGLTAEEYFILTKESFVSKQYWDTQFFVGGSHGIHTVQEYQNKIGLQPVGKYYGYSNDAEMLSLAELTPGLEEPQKSMEKETKKGLFFVKDQFLPRTGISFNELTNLLKTQYVNPKPVQGGIVVVGDTISLTDTCDLDAVRLNLGSPGLHLQRYERIHRFIRLWRKVGWTMDEVDQSISTEINSDYLHELVAIKKVADKTGLEISKVLCFWSNIGTSGDSSLYKRMFLTHNILADDKVFEPLNGNYLSQNPHEKISDHLPALIAALNLNATDISSLMNIPGDTMPDELTLENVSKLYRYRLLSKNLGFKVQELIAMRKLFGDMFANPIATFEFLKTLQMIDDAGFDYHQLLYVIHDEDDIKKSQSPTAKEILQLSKTIYDGLSAIDETHQDLKPTSATTVISSQEAEINSQATSELVREKASLYYDAVTVNKIMSILEGTAMYSATAPKNIRDNTKPVPPLGGTNQQFEFFKLENYPLLHGKVKYDATVGTVQVQGILDAAEETAFNDARKTAAGSTANPTDLDDWKKVLEEIKRQQSKLFNEVFETISPQDAQILKQGDIINQQIDPLTNVDNNTAPQKRGKFLKFFLPQLRKELSHRLIIDILSGTSGLERNQTETLATEVLVIGNASLYQALSDLRYQSISTLDNQNAQQKIWNGDLLPLSEDEYVFVIRNFIAGQLVKPVISIDDKQLKMEEQTDAPGEYWAYEEKQIGGATSSVPLKLKAGKQYRLKVEGIDVDLKNFYWKTNSSAPVQVPGSVLLPGFVKVNFTSAYALFKKCGIVINGFKLSADEIHHLYVNANNFGGLNFNQIDLPGFLRLDAYTRLRNSLPAGKINILDFFQWTNSVSGNNSNLSGKISALTNWNVDRIAELISTKYFNLTDVANFRNEINLLKLKDAISAIEKIGLATEMIFDAAKPSATFEVAHQHAEQLRKAIRSKHNQDDWEQVVKPLNDQLRDHQKNALISYLLVQPEIRKWGVKDSGGLFEYFLIDCEMDTCMETSRIKQAISSVQLFVQRCFLDLEASKSGIGTEILDRIRWEWMERYRIWEANRKIFVYPENWIESNLRDDKSPFFKELESELLQKDINSQNVQDALKSYLYKLDEVANMEIVGLYIDGGKKDNEWIPGSKMHVFARTKNAPYFFYYRYLAFDEMNWYPWEKMQVDIPSYDEENSNHRIQSTGCYLIPVVWNQRLLVFFPQFMKKTKPASTSVSKWKDMGENSPDSEKPIDYWEIKMGWSEYRNGKWIPKQLSKNAIYDDSVSSVTSDPNLSKFQKAAQDAAQNAQQALANDLQGIVDLNAAMQAYLNSLNIDYFYPTYIAHLTVELINASDADKPGIAARMTPDEHSKYIKDAEKKRDDAKAHWEDSISNQDTLNKKLKDANDAAESAQNDYEEALKNTHLEYTLNSISKFIFTPVFSNDNGNDKLLAVRVFNGSLDIGYFEFNGTYLSSKTRSYLGNTTSDLSNAAITNTDFHHINSTTANLKYIQSFENNEEASNNYFLQFGIVDAPYYRSLFKVQVGKGSNAYFTPNMWDTRFYHPFTHELLGNINSLSLNAFFQTYKNKPTDKDKADLYGYKYIYSSSPADGYHELKRPYSLYNWELFFHAPTMIADALSKSQQFEEAMKWYHYVFNPMTEGTKENPFWQFTPFNDLDAKRILDRIFNSLKGNEYNKDISEWRNNPFKPHLVARGRPVAYMKWVVMKYIDNLLAWGDYLFRQDTIESINQATQLYIFAGHILGPKPERVARQSKSAPQTYFSLLDKWDAFSNAMVQLEVVAPLNGRKIASVGKGNSNNINNINNSGISNINNGQSTTGMFGTPSSLYFGIPGNPKLMAYWDTIADRLFKIRHCENIEGVFRKLPLFEPPIDPALMVKAAAQGLNIASVLNDLNTPMPNYRFYYLLQKAFELCNELKSLGSALLSAIEKKDNETIALLRAKHESNVHSLVMEVKKQQVIEANKTMQSLQQNRKAPEHRMRYYLQLIGEDVGKVPGTDGDFTELANAIELPVDESGLKLIKYEKEDMDKANAAHDLQKDIGQKELLASILHLLPTASVDGKPFGIGVGVQFGGPFLGGAMQAWAKSLQNDANDKSFSSTKAGKKSGFLRSLQDRVMQANAAGYEIKQIDKQILAQQIRIDIANQEITNQQKLIDNAAEVEDFIKSKYSNEELYSWTKDNLNTLYHQLYSVAFDLAKKAEKVYCFERGLSSSNFIQGGYWDAGYNGLLSGEKLYVGLKQMEAAYQQNRGYDYEITKHISLKQINPMALVELRNGNKCEFELPEILFDMDYPGHFKRRIKSVSVSVPCIAGPYTSLNGTLRLLQSKFRNSNIAKNAAEYREKTDEDDNRFNSFLVPLSAIAASSGQMDGGMFELNFKDERYLPFEGAGVISKWRFELPAFRQFDYNTIADLIIHVRYTSAEGGEQLRNSAASNVTNYMKSVQELSKYEGLFSLIDLKHDTPNEWYSLKTNGSLDLKIDNSRFPFYAESISTKKIISVTLIGKLKETIQQSLELTLDNSLSPTTLDKNEDLQLYIGFTTDISIDKTFKLSVGQGDITNLQNVALLVKYSF